MKKTIATMMAICGLLAFSSCENVTWTQVQTQLSSWVTTESATMALVSGVLNKHPESLATFKQISGDLTSLTEKETINLADVKTDIEKRIQASDLDCKLEVLLAVESIFNKIGPDKQINVADYKEKILDIVSGINWAVMFYEEQHPTNEITVTK